jgi:hypothetical protein
MLQVYIFTVLCFLILILRNKTKFIIKVSCVRPAAAWDTSCLLHQEAMSIADLSHLNVYKYAKMYPWWQNHQKMMHGSESIPVAKWSWLFIPDTLEKCQSFSNIAVVSIAVGFSVVHGRDRRWVVRRKWVRNGVFERGTTLGRKNLKNKVWNIQQTLDTGNRKLD